MEVLVTHSLFLINSQILFGVYHWRLQMATQKQMIFHEFSLIQDENLLK